MGQPPPELASIMVYKRTLRWGLGLASNRTMVYGLLKYKLLAQGDKDFN